MLDLVTIIWALVLVGLLWRLRSRALLHPLLHYAVAHLVYFSEPPRFNEGLVGVGHFISGLSLVAGYYVVTKGLRAPHPAAPLPRPILLDNATIRYLAVGLLMAATLSWPLIAISEGYSLFDVLTSFYAQKVQIARLEGISGGLAVFTKLGFMGIVLGRIWFNMNSSRLYRQFYTVAFAVELLMMFASGIRSGLVFVFFSMVLADQYCDHVLGVRAARKSRLVLYVFSAAVILVGVAFLTAFRSRAFTDTEEIREELTAAVEDGRMKDAAKQAAVQNTNDCIAFSLVRYEQDETLGRGIFAMVVNPIPRLFWKQKPVGYGKILAHEMMGAALEPRGLSLAAGIVGEAFYNGRWAGVVVLSFAFGAIFGFVRRVVLATRDPARAACALYFIASLTGVVRGDWQALNVNFYYLVMTLSLIAFLRLLLGRPKLVNFQGQPSSRGPAFPPPSKRGLP